MSQTEHHITTRTSAPPHPKNSPSFSIARLLRRLLIIPVLKMRAHRLGPHIFKAAEECDTILDFGCGDMILTEFLTEKSPERSVIGVDTLDTNLTDMPVLLYDGIRLPFEDKSFDATIVGFVLHHCCNINEVLEELKRVTRKKLIIFEEVYRGRISQKILQCHDFGNRLLSSKMEIPLNFLTLEDWKKTFDRLDLSLRNTYRVYQYPFFNVTHQIMFDLTLQEI